MDIVTSYKAQISLLQHIQLEHEYLNPKNFFIFPKKVLYQYTENGYFRLLDINTKETEDFKSTQGNFNQDKYLNLFKFSRVTGLCCFDHNFRKVAMFSFLYRMTPKITHLSDRISHFSLKNNTLLLRDEKKNLTLFATKTRKILIRKTQKIQVVPKEKKRNFFKKIFKIKNKKKEEEISRKKSLAPEFNEHIRIGDLSFCSIKTYKSEIYFSDFTKRIFYFKCQNLIAGMGSKNSQPKKLISVKSKIKLARKLF